MKTLLYTVRLYKPNGEDEEYEGATNLDESPGRIQFIWIDSRGVSFVVTSTLSYVVFRKELA